MSRQDVDASDSSSVKPLESSKEVEEWFKKVDSEGAGILTPEKLKEALYWSQNKTFSEKACKLMVALFDVDRSGTISLKEFKRLCVYVNQWLHVFMMYDLNGSGSMDEREFSNSLTNMGYRLSDQFVQLIMRVFGGKSDEITLDQFIVACVQLQKYTEAFRVRDLGMTGTITLGYEDFLSIVLNSE